MVKFIRYLLFPIALLYGAIVAFRNFLFDTRVIKSSEFDVKTILVGNLSAGGTGKTPHIEYLIRLLGKEYKLATLSRGYGRKTTGFLKATDSSTAKDVGDEPLQFSQKFSDVEVFVDAKRVGGIVEIMSQEEVPEVILLDDAFQHRQLKAGLSILLTDFNSPFYKDFMLPTGNLREFPYGKKRADVIIVTKCPEEMKKEERERMIKKIGTPNIPVFFSKIGYSSPKGIFDESHYNLDEYSEILLVTGIANPDSLLDYLSKFNFRLSHLKYQDHYPFSNKDIQKIIETFESKNDSKKVILTTEKDAMRLKEFGGLKALPIAQIPIEVSLLEREEELNSLIKNYVKSD